MAKYKLKLNLNDGSIVQTTNAIEIPSDSDLVHKGTSSTASDEDIYGTKTFRSGGISFSSGSSTDVVNITSSGGAEVRICPSNTSFPTYLYLGSTSNSYGQLIFTTYESISQSHPNSEHATIQFSQGSGSTAKKAYLIIPNVGAYNDPKTIAVDEDVVHKGSSSSSVAEDIYGAKTFNNQIISNNGITGTVGSGTVLNPTLTYNLTTDKIKFSESVLKRTTELSAYSLKAYGPPSNTTQTYMEYRSSDFTKNIVTNPMSVDPTVTTYTYSLPNMSCTLGPGVEVIDLRS